jgi:hypothetical protein
MLTLAIPAGVAASKSGCKARVVDEPVHAPRPMPIKSKSASAGVGSNGRRLVRHMLAVIGTACERRTRG